MRGVAALAGTAERIPLTDDYVDAVTVGQAFHWFDEQPALREIHRVLRPGGGVALIWNARDERNPLQARSPRSSTRSKATRRAASSGTGRRSSPTAASSSGASARSSSTCR